jgi:hypothetical protein
MTGRRLCPVWRKCQYLIRPWCITMTTGIGYMSLYNSEGLAGSSIIITFVC